MIIEIRGNKYQIIDKSDPFIYEVKDSINNIQFIFGEQNIVVTKEKCKQFINSEFTIKSIDVKYFFGDYTHLVKLTTKLGNGCWNCSSYTAFLVYNPLLQKFKFHNTGSEALAYSRQMDKCIISHITMKIKDIYTSRQEVEQRNKNSYENKFKKQPDGIELQKLITAAPIEMLLGVQNIVQEEIIRRKSGDRSQSDR